MSEGWMSFFIGFLIAAGLVYCLTGEEDFKQEVQNVNTYCEMVELRQNDPNLGWPDYKGIYEEVCR